MAHTPKILAFAGSARTDSFNKKLVKVAIKGAEEAGAKVTYIDLRDLPMPLYDGDLEASDGLPSNAKTLKSLMQQHDGFLISSPEYNSSVSGYLKNVIDWVSRPEKGETTSLVAFRDKAAALMSASPGALGGLRGLVHLRALLENIYVLVLPDQVTVSQAGEAFTPDGLLKDAKKQSSVIQLGTKLTQVIGKLRTP